MAHVTLTFRSEEEAIAFYNAVGYFISDKKSNMHRSYPTEVTLENG